MEEQGTTTSSRRRDTCSSANSREVVVHHWNWEVAVDFSSKTLSCTITLDVKTLSDGVTRLVYTYSGRNLYTKREITLKLLSIIK